MLLEPPRVVLRSPVPVPKTCPQCVVCLGGDRSHVTLAAGDVCPDPQSTHPSLFGVEHPIGMTTVWPSWSVMRMPTRSGLILTTLTGLGPSSPQGLLVAGCVRAASRRWVMVAVGDQGAPVTVRRRRGWAVSGRRARALSVTSRIGRLSRHPASRSRSTAPTPCPASDLSAAPPPGGAPVRGPACASPRRRRG
jgi:hypothetical protein